MSEIRVDRFKAEDGISAPQFPNGINVTGVVTASVLDVSVPFLDAGSNVKIGAAGIITATSFTGGSFSGSTISGTTGTFSGNVSVGGVLTYEDVTNVDSIGLVTARTGVVSPYADIDDFLDVGNSIQLGNAGIATAAGLTVGGATSPVNVTHTGGNGINITRSSKTLGFNGNYGGSNTHALVQLTTGMDLIFELGDTDRIKFKSAGHIEPVTDSQINLGSNSIRFANVYADNFYGAGANLTGIVSIPTGAIMAWPTETAPSGFILCQGQAISRSTYSALFAIIASTYGGGDGSSNFNIPDYRGQFLRGRANGSTNDPDRGARTDRGDGNGGDNVGTKQDYGILEHTHGNNSGGTSHHGFNTNNNNTGTFSKSGHSYGGTRSTSGGIVTNSWGNNSANVDGHLTNNEIRPINIYVNWIMKT